MLGQRILTAIILLAVLAGVLAAPGPWPLMILLAVAAGCALWEWIRLVLPSAWPRRLIPALCVLLMLGLSASWLQFHPDQAPPWAPLFERALVPLAALFWVLPATLMVLCARPLPPFGPRVLAGCAVLALFAVWYALARIYLDFGAQCLVSLLALIWCADIAAYFTGRAFGRHKLAPRVSPGKTWEGAGGGVAAATAWLLVTAWWWPESYGARLLELGSTAWVLAAGVLLAAWSIIGDLFESLLKRRAGVKDSSRLLPGHGGVYDRIDAVLPVTAIALLFLIN
ncbi:phosphatidate cytidylyltransferase [Castellaniella sp. GW247-6E4]|uniref:phosphatidate cytidylyltransferase n=1 Tax=Castellaniella sp. GW247-6E4 TaxID=3140380 RepID=UPI003315F3D6